jgi:hypothetical protein
MQEFRGRQDGNSSLRIQQHLADWRRERLCGDA